MATDIHKKEFTSETIVKLDILRMYLRKWLPTFIENSKPWYNQIFISDLFAGEGTDSEGNYGSPLIMLEELAVYCNSLKTNNLKVTAVFNEGIKKKARVLEGKCKEFRDICFSQELCPCHEKNECVPEIYLENDDFSIIFDKLFEELKEHNEIPHFMFLDQYGVKQITEKVFLNLIKLKLTDFMFFFASSFAKRFIEQDEFKQYLTLTKEDFETAKPDHCHRVICNYYRSMIPKDTEFYIAPFSIKKGRNIYGLIFGSHSLKGLQKFLEVCWALDKETGEANYDIDGDSIRVGQMSMFEEDNCIKKQDQFKSELAEFIITPRDNKSIYAFTLESGFLPKHTNALLKEMQKSGEVQVWDEQDNKPARRGSFYLDYKYLKTPIKVTVKRI